MTHENFANGAYGYDIGQVPPQPVLITDPDKGPVKSHKPALRELILDSPGNRAVRADMESDTVGVQYIELDGSGGKEYTMPVERIATPSVEVNRDGDSLRPHHYVMYLGLRELFSELAMEDDDLYDTVLDSAANAGLPEPVVEALRADDTKSDE